MLLVMQSFLFFFFLKISFKMCMCSGMCVGMLVCVLMCVDTNGSYRRAFESVELEVQAVVSYSTNSGNEIWIV